MRFGLDQLPQSEERTHSPSPLGEWTLRETVALISERCAHCPGWCPQSLAIPQKWRRIRGTSPAHMRRATGTEVMAATVMMEPGETLRKYRALEVVSIGRIAIVYRAKDPELRREVALKVIAPPIATMTLPQTIPEQGQGRRQAPSPQHRPGPRLRRHQGGLFIVMRFIRGKRLRTGCAPIVDGRTNDQPWCRSRTRLTPRMRSNRPPQRQASEHHRQHRHRAPICRDFRIAKRVATTSFNETSGFIGTLDYAAPEQILGHEVTPGLTSTRSRQSLSLLDRPACISGETDAAVLHAHVYEPPPTVAADHPGAAVLNALTARGMAKEPGARFASASELMHEASGLVDAWPAISPDMLEPEDGHRSSTDGSLATGRQACATEASCRRRRPATMTSYISDAQVQT